MSSVQIHLPEGLSWASVGLLSIPALLVWQTALVGKARKLAKIEYPRAYAEKAEQDASLEAKVFNCVQRAHQNTLENVPVAFVTTLLTTIYHPKYAAILSGTWSLSRVIYTLGYATGNPKNRMAGAILGDIALIGLFIGAGTTAYNFFKAGL